MQYLVDVDDPCQGCYFADAQLIFNLLLSDVSQFLGVCSVGVPEVLLEPGPAHHHLSITTNTHSKWGCGLDANTSTLCWSGLTHSSTQLGRVWLAFFKVSLEICEYLSI